MLSPPAKDSSQEGFHPLPLSEPPPHADEFHELAKYLHALRRRWPLLLVCSLVAVTFALIKYSLTTKEYRATTTIQIERKRMSLFALGQAGLIEDWWNVEYYPTQYRLLRSRGMAERVVLNLRLQEDPEFVGKPGGLVGSSAEVPLSSAEDAAQLARLASQVQGGLTVNPIKDTQLVELSFVSPSPELAARIANGYADAFIQWGIQTRTETVRGASGFLGSQIETLRREIEDRQKQLNTFAADSKAALDPAGEALLERRRTLEQQYNKVVGERIGKEATYRELLKQSSDSLASSLAGDRINLLRTELFQLENDYEFKLKTYTPEWPAMVDLKTKIDEKREQLQRLTEVTADEMRETAAAAYQKAQREEVGLEGELRKLADEARQLNSSSLEYNNLLTNIETRKSLLADLQKRQSETDVASRLQSQQESNVRVVDSAVVPAHPFRPSLDQDLWRGLLVGLMLGLAAILLFEYLDRTVKTPEELEALLRIPTLAVVPDLDPKRASRLGSGQAYGYGYGYGYGGPARASARRLFSRTASAAEDAGVASDNSIELLPHRNPRLAVCEAYRSLRTALLLSSAEELRVIALTSAEPSEGKTATTVNLAVVLAQLGRKVLIIDGDLRRPRIHKIFKVSNRVGLVNSLTSGVELERVGLPTEVPNLLVCPSGPIPPNPSELLAAERMRAFLNAARTRFHYILIDTPPMLPVADGLILGALADGVVICARAGALLRDDARACRERLRYSELRLLGAVLNRHRVTPGRYAKRYRYYGSEEVGTAETQNSAA